MFKFEGAFGHGDQATAKQDRIRILINNMKSHKKVGNLRNKCSKINEIGTKYVMRKQIESMRLICCFLIRATRGYRKGRVINTATFPMDDFMGPTCSLRVISYP